MGVYPETGSNRINRGGNFNNSATNTRSANRNNNTPTNRNNNIGLRLFMSSKAILTDALGPGTFLRSSNEPKKRRARATGKCFYSTESCSLYILKMFSDLGPSESDLGPSESDLGPSEFSSTDLKILELLKSGPLNRQELAESIGHRSISGYLKHSIAGLLKQRLIEYTLPDKPTSHHQKFKLSEPSSTEGKN